MCKYTDIWLPLKALGLFSDTESVLLYSYKKQLLELNNWNPLNWCLILQITSHFSFFLSFSYLNTDGIIFIYLSYQVLYENDQIKLILEEVWTESLHTHSQKDSRIIALVW